MSDPRPPSAPGGGGGSGSGSGTERGLLRSTGAATFSQLWRVGVTFVVHAILRRWVAEGDWGLWHWSEPILIVLGQLRDLGLPGHVVRTERDRPYGAYLLVQLLWGAAVVVLLIGIAPLLARGTSDLHPEVVPVLRLLAIFLLFEGLAKVPLTFFEAELAIGRSVVPELARNTAYAVVSLLLAYAGHGVWSMVVAQVVAAGVFCLALWIRAAGRMPLTVGEGLKLRWLRGGAPLAALSLLVMLQGKVDGLVLGARFAAEVVGRYGMALFLAFLLPSIVALPVRRALYPAMVALRGDRIRFFEVYRLATVLLLAIEVPYALLLFTNAETVLVLYGGEAYRSAAPILRILCWAPLVEPLSRCGADVLIALHRDRVMLAGSALTLGSLVGVGTLLSLWIGPEGMAWANLLPAGAVIYGWALYRLFPGGLRSLARDLAIVYLTPVPLFLAASMAPSATLRLALSLLAAGLAAALYGWRFGDGFVAFFRTHSDQRSADDDPHRSL